MLVSRFRVEVNCDRLAVALFRTSVCTTSERKLLASAATTSACWALVSLVLRESRSWSWASPPLRFVAVAARNGVVIRLGTLLASTVPFKAATTAVWAV